LTLEIGYNFSIHETKRVGHRLSRSVDVTLASSKIRRLKSRVCRAVARFTIDSDVMSLERRLQLLTGNYNLRDVSTGRLRNVGLYCNYRRANSDAALIDLDVFMRSVFVGRRAVLTELYRGLEISSGMYFSFKVIEEMEQNPWFVNWKQIDLLNHLRKKELRAVY
jgi:hypothetical protein